MGEGGRTEGMGGWMKEGRKEGRKERNKELPECGKLKPLRNF